MSAGWLEGFLRAHGAVAGTVHRLREGALELDEAVNIPAPVVEATRRIPRGKGMAGLAWERLRPVTTCNLQTDASGDVRPGARAVSAAAAAALPVVDDDGVLRAVVGIAFAEARDLPETELQALARAARSLPR